MQYLRRTLVSVRFSVLSSSIVNAVTVVGVVVDSYGPVEPKP